MLRIQNCVFEYNDIKIPLISGEVQYWRITREYWDNILQGAKELGLRVIASYVPWVYHEIAEGVYDFTGQTTPQYDLIGFIELLKKYDMYFIIRPGPYIYGSMPNGGVPDRAAHYSRLDPEFLKMARHYLHAFAKIIHPHQITQGGNIILCQADNEPSPNIESLGTETGCFERDGDFKNWLRMRYQHDLARLNASWNSNYSDFNEACLYFHEAYVDTDRPMAGRLLNDPGVFPRYADSHKFIGWYAANIVRETKRCLQEGGLEIPVFANSWSPLFQDCTQFCNDVDLTGIDVYPTPFFETGGPVKDNWFYNLDILKLQAADVTNGNVWSAEYQGGTYEMYEGRPSAQHFRYVNRVFMSQGLRGWNWYILATRGNWVGNPLREFGEHNYSFDAVRGQNRLAQELEIWNGSPVNDLSLFCYKPHRVIDPGDFESCFNLLQQADFSFDYFDPEATTSPSTNVLLYSGGDWVDDATYDKLSAFVQEGGNLIAFNHYPRRGCDQSQRTGMGFVDPDGIRPVNLPVEISFGANSYTIRDVGHLNCKTNLFFYRNPPGQPIMTRLSMEAKELLLDKRASVAATFALGYVLERGKGRIFHIGCNPSLAMLKAVMNELHISAACSVDGQRLLTAIHHYQSGRRVLYVVNRAEIRQLCHVRLDPVRNQLAAGAVWTVRDPDTNRTDEVTTEQLQTLLVPVDARDVGIRVIEMSAC